MRILKSDLSLLIGYDDWFTPNRNSRMHGMSTSLVLFIEFMIYGLKKVQFFFLFFLVTVVVSCIHKTNERVSSNWPQLVWLNTYFSLFSHFGNRKNFTGKKQAVTTCRGFGNEYIVIDSMSIKCAEKHLFFSRNNKFYKIVVYKIAPNK